MVNFSRPFLLLVLLQRVDVPARSMWCRVGRFPLERPAAPTG
ncbi:hypothetical protein ACFUCQ_09830 [Streptomyces sp. NPDC057197]